jgi:thymidylate synthase (FAD)
MIKVLDKGFVRLVESMGNDASIVQAARVSTGSGAKTPEEDRKLIRYMMQHHHTSVFEQVIFKFHVKAPIFVYRQWHRHRTWSYNEQSGRYSKLPEEYYVPNIEQINKQSKNNKQGRAEPFNELDARDLQETIRENNERCFVYYHEALEEDLSREVARIQLPLATYSEMYATVDLHNLFHFLKLRMAPEAQHEIQVYAKAMYELIKPIVPVACEAFEDYVLNAVTFSAQEMELVHNIADELVNLELRDLEWIQNRAGWYDQPKLSKREVADFKKKLGL